MTVEIAHEINPHGCRKELVNRLKSAAYATALIAHTLASAGCALAPGMYAGGLDTGFQVAVSDPTGVEDILVPVIPITSVPTLSEASHSDLQKTDFPYEYRLGIGDSVRIIVWEHPELTNPQGDFQSTEAQGIIIDEQGMFVFPYCGRVRAVELTQEELRQTLYRCLSKTIRRPQISVSVARFRSQFITVVGGVARPGMVPITDQPLHLYQAIQAVGGVSTDGNERFVNIVRKGMLYRIDLSRYGDTGALGLNPVLQSGDVVKLVPAQERRVGILGEVRQPQTLVLGDDAISLSDALVKAAGLSPDSAEPDRILVMRQLADTPTVYWMRGNDALSLVAAQGFELKPGDLIYVDQTGLSRWARTISQMLPGFSLLNQGSSIRR